ncbi:hypothetical protein HK104_004221 [Borealophlyctis nickersoniae]|nr:hypothetical protein HK104_004221 [Borealophlyctis nickersoniae]
MLPTSSSRLSSARANRLSRAKPLSSLLVLRPIVFVSPLRHHSTTKPLSASIATTLDSKYPAQSHHAWYGYTSRSIGSVSGESIPPSSALASQQVSSTISIGPPPPCPSIVLPTVQQQQQQPVQSSDTQVKEKTFYRRDLPSHLTSFTSADGRRLFKECIASNTAEIYFSLSGNFTTQSEPSFCGLGSLAMVLNALCIDPGKKWKGVWRWYSDTMLECCRPLGDISKNGVTFTELACLARCNGLRVESKRADQVTKEEFLSDLQRCCGSEDTHMIVSFSRKALGQTGDGHFSPVGAYHPDENKVLVLDTARFKYPSYFCDADLLYEAMKGIDKVTGLPRGYFILTRGETKPIALTKLASHIVDWPHLTDLFLTTLPHRLRSLSPISILDDVVRHVLSCLPNEKGFFLSLQRPGVDLASPAEESGKLASDHATQVDRLIAQTRLNPIFGAVQRVVEGTPGMRPLVGIHKQEDVESAIALATIFMLAAPRECFVTLPDAVLSAVEACRSAAVLGRTPLLRQEVERIGEQLQTLLNTYCKCGKRKGFCGPEKQ